MAEGLGTGSRPPGELDQLSLSPSKFYSKSLESEAAAKPVTSPRAQNMIQAMTMDQVCVTSRLHRYKKAYLDYRLGSCDRLYSTDILGHHGCVNALAFSKGQEEFLATGKGQYLGAGMCQISSLIVQTGSLINCLININFLRW